MTTVALTSEQCTLFRRYPVKFTYNFSILRSFFFFFFARTTHGRRRNTSVGGEAVPARIWRPGADYWRVRKAFPKMHRKSYRHEDSEVNCIKKEKEESTCTTLNGFGTENWVEKVFLTRLTQIERRLSAAALALTVAIAPSNTEHQTEGSQVLSPFCHLLPPTLAKSYSSVCEQLPTSLSLSHSLLFLSLSLQCANFTSLFLLSRSCSLIVASAIAEQSHVFSPSGNRRCVLDWGEYTRSVLVRVTNLSVIFFSRCISTLSRTTFGSRDIYRLSARARWGAVIGWANWLIANHPWLTYSRTHSPFASRCYREKKLVPNRRRKTLYIWNIRKIVIFQKKNQLKHQARALKFRKT